MLLGVGFIAAMVAAAVAWRLLSPVFSAETFARLNRHNRRLPTAAGLVVVLVVVGGGAVVMVARAAGVDILPATSAGLELVVVAVVAFGLLGLLDDLGGVGQSGGFRRHLSELGRGRVTTGAVKLFGGGAVGVIVAAPISADRGVGRLLVDAALVALAANLANLLDRAPGRTTKVATVVVVGLVLVSASPHELLGVVIVIGAAWGLLVPELTESLMLGDVGANAIGGAVGVGLLLTLDPTGRTVALVVLVVLNGLSEVVSFSAVIDRVRPLRWVDRLGTRPS